jgi:hypothetical protein
VYGLNPASTLNPVDSVIARYAVSAAQEGRMCEPREMRDRIVARRNETDKQVRMPIASGNLRG